MYTSTNNNFFVPHTVTEDIKYLEMPLSAKFLYQILCKLANRHADEKGWFWRSIPQLSKDTGMNKKTVSVAKKKLLINEFIDVQPTFFKHSKKRSYDSYRLNGFRFRGNKKEV